MQNRESLKSSSIQIIDNYIAAAHFCASSRFEFSMLKRNIAKFGDSDEDAVLMLIITKARKYKGSTSFITRVTNSLANIDNYGIIKSLVCNAVYHFILLKRYKNIEVKDADLISLANQEGMDTSLSTDLNRFNITHIRAALKWLENMLQDQKTYEENYLNKIKNEVLNCLRLSRALMTANLHLPPEILTKIFSFIYPHPDEPVQSERFAINVMGFFQNNLPETLPAQNEEMINPSHHSRHCCQIL